MNLICKQQKQHSLEWAEELSQRLGCSQEEVILKGLKASDFPISSSIDVSFPDGSKVYFEGAFLF